MGQEIISTLTLIRIIHWNHNYEEDQSQSYIFHGELVVLWCVVIRVEGYQWGRGALVISDCRVYAEVNWVETLEVSAGASSTKRSNNKHLLKDHLKERRRAPSSLPWTHASSNKKVWLLRIRMVRTHKMTKMVKNESWTRSDSQPSRRTMQVW